MSKTKRAKVFVKKVEKVVFFGASWAQGRMPPTSMNVVVFPVHAAGRINGDGTNGLGLECSIARVGLGTYELRLNSTSGLDPSESYLQVTPRTDNFNITALGVPTVIDQDPFVKTIITVGPDGQIADLGFSFVLFRSSLPPIGVSDNG